MSASLPLARAFAAALPEPLAAGVAPDRSLEATLADAVARARAAFPTISVPAEVLVTHAAERWADTPLDAQAVAALHWPDVLLVCGCARRDAEAAAVFEREQGAVIEAAVRRINAPPAALDEAAQRARTHLLVAEPDALPRIAQYSGRAPLSGYVRVVAARVALGMLRSDPAAREVGDQVLAAVADGRDGPEIAYLKRHYAAEFRDAFAVALAALSARDRSLLRYQLVDGLDLAQIGQIYGRPRSTVGRHVQEARARLIEGTRRHLRQRLELSRDELESILRLVESSVNVSVSRLLREGAPSLS